jgi:hypothetical protein
MWLHQMTGWLYVGHERNEILVGFSYSSDLVRFCNGELD